MTTREGTWTIRGFGADAEGRPRVLAGLQRPGGSRLTPPEEVYRYALGDVPAWLAPALREYARAQEEEAKALERRAKGARAEADRAIEAICKITEAARG